MSTTPKPISQMLEKTALVDNDLFEIVDSEETNLSLKNKKVKFSKIKSEIGGVEEAPEDGNTYGREDASWVQIANPITELGADRYELRGDNDGGTLFDIINEGTTAGTRALRLSVPNGTTQGEAALQVTFGSMTLYCYADGTMYVAGSGTIWFAVADIRMPNLPTSAPAESGRLWNNSNVVNIV